MASPFTSRLGTNYCPQDEEIAHILALIAGPSLRLETLEALGLRPVPHALHKLAEEREKLATYVDAHRALLSPARRLPRDVIQEIFMACLPMRRNCVMSATEAPVLLGRICRAWRDLSLDTAALGESSRCRTHYALWRQSVSLPPRQESSPAISNHQNVVRSIRPMHFIPIVALRHGVSNPVICPRTGCFLDALIPYASRWEHISFVGPHLRLCQRCRT
ncbi:hypothetical protein C8F04DRAFT_955342 [Mycena alexandri]|uniref:F-box domain-containing protein n=1 Tax=Mycena alexandri TaxID=1745969 RepID=A0AAD6X3E0_9AGAR|nr:hypothetical protein C8F04DRAFT_955342 [Mycena alexandri]